MSIFGNRGKTATEEDLSLIKSGKNLVAFYSWADIAHIGRNAEK